MRDFIMEYVMELGLEESQRDRLEVGFEEPLINIISYAYKVPGKIWLRVGKDEADVPAGASAGKNFIIELMDYGVPFNPLTEEDARPDEATPLEERKAGGYGIYFMKGIFNHIFYERRDFRGEEANFLRLVFAIG